MLGSELRCLSIYTVGQVQFDLRRKVDHHEVRLLIRRASFVDERGPSMPPVKAVVPFGFTREGASLPIASAQTFVFLK